MFVAIPPDCSQHATYDGVHRGGDGARNGDERIRKVRRRQHDAEGGVLHANLDAHCTRRLGRKAGRAREEISDTETERVQENDGTDERGTSGENLVRGTSYYGRANQRHGENRDDRCEGFDALAEFCLLYTSDAADE